MCAYSFHSCCNLIISEDNVTKTAAKGFIRIKWCLVDFTESTSKNMCIILIFLFVSSAAPFLRGTMFWLYYICCCCCWCRCCCGCFVYGKMARISNNNNTESIVCSYIYPMRTHVIYYAMTAEASKTKKIEEKVGCFLTCCYDALPMKQAKWHVIIIVYLRAIWYSGWSAVIHECMHYLFTRYNMMLSYMCACPCVLAGGCWDAKVCLLDTIGRSHLLTLYAYERPLFVLFIQFVCLLRTLNLH